MTSLTNKSVTLFDLLIGKEHHPAIVAPDKPSLTYGQLRQQIIELTAQLNNFGIRGGSRIAIAMPNSPEMILTYLAAATCGTATPLNPKYKQEEFAFYYQDTQAIALIGLGEGIAAAQAAVTPEMMLIQAIPKSDGTLSLQKIQGKEYPPRTIEQTQPEDVAMILHTSGTTSRPKRVPIKHRNLTASARKIISTYNLSASDRAFKSSTQISLWFWAR